MNWNRFESIPLGLCYELCRQVINSNLKPQRRQLKYLEFVSGKKKQLVDYSLKSSCSFHIKKKFSQSKT